MIYLEKIILSHFRNYTREEVFFSPQLNCIQGDNAEGKSSLLEAIYLISTGKSFRTSHIKHLIGYNQSQFQLEVSFVKEDISHKLQISYGPQGRKVVYNQTNYASFLPLLGILPCVILVPEDISIIMGAPSERRRFLDLHISQMDPLYVHHLGRYHKSLKQRNVLLKKRTSQGLDPWEQIMALSASYLIEKRKKALTDLQETIGEVVSVLSDTKESFSWSYLNSLESSDEQEILQIWKKNRSKELLLGTTLMGPHRDELSLQIQNQEIKTYCSEGQKRSFIAALRLAEWKQFKKFFGYSPLFGVDDFGIHLDEKRTTFLQRSMEGLGQVFLTAPSFSLQQDLLQSAKLLSISQGSLSLSL